MLAPATELPDEFRPLHRDEYDRLVELGVFEGTRVQLLGGVLIEMSPQKDTHHITVVRLNMALTPQVVGRHSVSVQGPLLVDDVSEPEPDLTILGDPTPKTKSRDALLVIEVADSSLRVDLGEKARRYAAAGYPEYWVIDVTARVLIRHLDPQPDGTWSRIDRLADGVVEPVAVDDVRVDLAELLEE